MKKLCFFVILLISTCCKAQTWDEWFRQRKTQIEYLEKQIIALQVYGNYLQEGYNIVQGGLSAIHNIKDGDFHLHNDYFNSLKQISPSVSSYSKVSGTINLQLQILQLNAAINKVLSNNSIQDNERHYVKAVMKSMLQKCGNDITDLTNLTTNGQLEMKEDERIKRIDAIYDDMKDKYTFVTHFKEQVNVLMLSRQKESDDMQTLQSLYNLK
ncbi:hypothetical protein FC093_21935 [Ilyomonas limi]|uniref:TerB family tellurite resistance protein n=1 Tax=Ilyomonas limi TaxID=2575867 RepID=A0A4U3KR65_9BACT|nr:hypothetical protein [Ilyomonas limi]TKK64711.1 hypothetical protein FC093_21935 [Ilyomonas limi]